MAGQESYAEECALYSCHEERALSGGIHAPTRMLH
jgi:hypothetical protein